MARSVVFRAIRPELMENSELSTKFLAAVKRGGQISHPNFVRMYDIGRTAKRCYATVEYIDGRSAARLLADKPGFAVAEAARIVAEARAEIQADLDEATAKADAEIATKAAESERHIAEIRASALESVTEVAQDTAAALVAAMGGEADDKTVTAAVTARMKG